MSKRQLYAYYYEFQPTGVDAIDKILGAVACAGKAEQHTGGWDDALPDGYHRDDHTGKTLIEWIQNAANEAAKEWGK